MNQPNSDENTQESAPRGGELLPNASPASAERPELPLQGPPIGAACTAGLTLGDGAACDQDAPAAIGAEERTQKTTELLAEYHDDVFRYAYRLAGQESLADDIVQETFIRVYKSVHQLKAPAAAKGWLLAIARNEFIRWCRRKKATTSLEDQGEIENAASGGAVQAIDNQEWVQEALGSMKEEHRIIVAMYYYEQLSYSEIAGQLDIPIGTVMSRLNRAKTSLRQQLLQKGGDDE